VLVLTRKAKQSIMIGDDIEVTVLSVDGVKVRLGFQAPADVPVFRTEIYREIQRELEAGEREPDPDADVERQQPGSSEASE
jgi:carbon storage regulator